MRHGFSRRAPAPRPEKTIVDFEKSRRDVSRAAVHAMQNALEKAGVQFIAKNGGGPGVRLRG
jgi:hypothetical protein